ncbi:hypothetical protein BTVI_09819 [Pitangus sulphuratus]|nr:hypothetical protein BTVI_09819 [Pitangus sulphuratus]
MTRFHDTSSLLQQCIYLYTVLDDTGDVLSVKGYFNHPIDSKKMHIHGCPKIMTICILQTSTGRGMKGNAEVVSYLYSLTVKTYGPLEFDGL